jgi:serine/threonine protein kinase/WD40 repeat protein
MSQNQKCSKCGAELPPGAPGGHCLKCLLELGLSFREAGSLPPTIVGAIAVVEKSGDVIGRYKLLQQIGEGGCGVVYMAEQVEPVRRQVALKVIKLGMDTKQVIIRFEAERQALALMDHPNIAKVLDAGVTETGRPYFVMELVRGIKITDYCNEQKLSTGRRLDLFILACQAIQHAHQKGIIHRDIKPSNILVTEQDGTAVPKIIDFGIAKATTDQRLTDKTFLTAFEQFLGTPAYMSPEQAGLGGLDIDTRSDIYSLGVLLYELLTGQPLFNPEELRRAALDEILRTIREKEPPRPSARLTTLTKEELSVVADCRQTEPAKFSRQLDGDLDWIVMKCLEKDRAHRYETANGLAKDIERHLNCEPVVARPPSNLDRARKLVQRHKLVFLAIGIIAATLLIGLASSTILFFREAKATKEANRQTERARSAEAETKEKLWALLLAEAQAVRSSKQAGRRFDGLKLVNEAALIRPSLELRNEAIACMALSDVWRFKELDLGDPNDSWGGFDGDYERYVFADTKGTIHIRRVVDNSELEQFSGYSPPFWAVELSPDGRYLFTGCGKKQDFVELRDLIEKKIVLHLSDSGFRAMEFSADSRFLAVAYNSESNHWPIHVYELPSGRELASFAHGSLPYYLRFNPRQPNLLLTSDGSNLVRVWDWKAGKVLETFYHPDWVQGICWSPGGSVVATACADFNVRLWDFTTGNLSAVLHGHDGAAVRVTFSADGELLASGGWDGKLILWDVPSQHELMNMQEPGSGFMRPFSQTARKLGIGTEPGKIEILEPEDGLGYHELRAGQLNEGTVNCDFSPDGKLLLATYHSGLRLWDAASGKPLFHLPWEPSGTFTFVRFHPNGTNFFLVSANAIQEWSLIMSETNTSLTRRISWNVNRKGNLFGLSQDGNILATSTDGAVHLFNTVNGWDLMSTPNNRYEAAALNADGRLLAAWSTTTTAFQGPTNVDVWDVGRSNLVKVLPAGNSPCAVFSADNRWLVVGDESRYCVWDVHTWQPLYSVPRKYAGFYGIVAITHDSAVMAVAISRNKVQLIELTTGRELATLEPQEQSQINSMTFNHDGTQLAVMCAAGAVQLWDLRVIRRQLAGMNLDWNLAAFSPSAPGLANP